MMKINTFPVFIEALYLISLVALTVCYTRNPINGQTETNNFHFNEFFVFGFVLFMRRSFFGYYFSDKWNKPTEMQCREADRQKEIMWVSRLSSCITNLENITSEERKENNKQNNRLVMKCQRQNKEMDAYIRQNAVIVAHLCMHRHECIRIITTTTNRPDPTIQTTNKNLNFVSLTFFPH